MDANWQGTESYANKPQGSPNDHDGFLQTSGASEYASGKGVTVQDRRVFQADEELGL